MMRRASTIAIAAVSSGVLIAGASASLAVINAASSVPTSDSVILAADAAAVAPENVAPTLTPADLPEVNPGPTETAGKDKPAKDRKMSFTGASALVQAQVSGKVLSLSKSSRGGYKAFAVTVLRGDGSTVTGYVDRASGVIFHWSQTPAPAEGNGPAASPGKDAHGQSPKPSDNKGGEQDSDSDDD